MSLLTFKEIDDNRGAEISETGTVTRRRSWYFVYDSHQTDAITVTNDFSTRTGIRRYTTYVGADGATDPTCRCVSLKPEQTTDFGKWIVRAVYSSGPAGSGGFANTPRKNRERAEMARRGLESGGQEQPDPDPRNRPPSIQWGSQEYEEELRFDAETDETLMTPALELFVPPPTVTHSYRTLTIERNEAIGQYSPFGTIQYENKVNGNEFYGFPARTVLCKSITANLDVEGEFAFWAATYVFWIRADGWQLKTPLVGYQEIDPATGGVKPILMKTGSLPASPQPLDQNGRRQPPGVRPHVKSWNRYGIIDFTSLGL